MKTIYKKGFTLLEFLVVLSIVVFIVPALFGVMFSLLRQQSRIYALQEVKRQGDLVLNHMKTTLKNYGGTTYSSSGFVAGSLSAPVVQCFVSGSSFQQPLEGNLYFEDGESPGTFFGYRSIVGTTIRFETNSTDPALTQTDLTNAGVTLSASNPLTVLCSRSNDLSTPLITISYTVQHPTLTDVSLR